MTHQKKAFTTRTSSGMTLIEMLVTIFIYGLLIVAIINIIILMFSQANIRNAALTSTDQVRWTGIQLTNEIRDAQSGNDGSYAIGEASSTEIIFYSSFHSPSTTTVQRIRYFLSNQTLYKGTITPTGNPLSYVLSNEKVKPVIIGVMNTSTPVFQYYDGTYAGTSSPLTQPVNITSIAFVEFKVQALQKEKQTATTTYLFDAGAAVRTLKNNLGN